MDFPITPLTHLIIEAISQNFDKIGNVALFINGLTVTWPDGETHHFTDNDDIKDVLIQINEDLIDPTWVHFSFDRWKVAAMEDWIGEVSDTILANISASAN